MADSDRIYIDDATGKQIASPEDATNGGSVSLKGDDAKAWLKANAAKALPKADAEEKAAAKSENKEAPQARNKGQKA